MPNLPKPRLRRATRRGDSLLGAAPQSEPQTPRVEQIDSSGLRWVNVERPGALERAWLEENFDFHALDLEDVLSRNQRPKIDVYDEYLFIVLHFPVFDPQAGRLGTGELDLFVGPDYLVTIPNQPLQPVEYLFERCRAKEEMRDQLFSRGSRYLASDLDLEIYFDDIVDAHERIWDMLENYKEVVGALAETNESVISHRVNDILRVLTSISVIVLPLTLITSIWGANVHVPGEGDSTAFWILLGAMIAMLVAMVGYFRNRGWL